MGPRLLVLSYAVLFPLGLIGHYTKTFEMSAILGLIPGRFWHGEIWRAFSYGFLGGSFIDWLINLFWLATMASVLGRCWSALEFWVYCLIAIGAGSLPILIFQSGSMSVITGAWGMVFALLIAWDFFYRHERLVLLGLGEISVRQAVIGIAILDSLILFFSCAGWLIMVSMWCGGLAGWIYLVARSHLLLRKGAQPIQSGRVARLEL
jgi:membrane associated rhomboid family serine protease